MTTNNTYKVSFRIRHPSMEPMEIALQLGLHPGTQHKAGSGRVTPKGALLKGTYDISYCSFPVEIAGNTSLPSAMRDFNRRLVGHREFLSRIVDTGGSLEYFVGWFLQNASVGEVFGWQLLKECGELRIDLALDVYGADAESDH